MKKVIAKVRKACFSKHVMAGTAAAAVAAPLSSFAALSTEQAAMVTAVETAFTDIAGAISSMATSNLGVAIAIVIAGLVIGYALRAGRG